MKSLYVTDRRAAGEGRWRAVLEALRGAPDLSVQVREKDVADREFLEAARAARDALGPFTPLYVNRRFDVALAAGADGVHLPDGGLPVAAVRSRTPRGFRVGVSTHAPGDALRALGEGADLVLLGPIFATPSKASWGPPLGPEALGALPARGASSPDVFAIGGITEETLDALEPYRERISGVAAIRLFQDAADPRAVAERIARR